jgi:Co/Zn/Cd efflux system component
MVTLTNVSWADPVVSLLIAALIFATQLRRAA